MRFLALYETQGSRHVPERLKLLKVACESSSVEFTPVDVGKPSSTWPRPKDHDIVFAVTRGCYYAEPNLISPRVASIYKSGTPFLGYDSDTTVFSAYLQSCEVACPRTLFVDGNSSNVEAFVREVGFPLVIKVAGGTGGVGTALIETHRQLAGVIELVLSSSKRFLLIEHLDHEVVYRVAVVGGRAVEQATKPKRSTDFRSTGFGANVERSSPSSLIASFSERCADLLGVTCGGLDVVVDKEGMPHLLEYNLRFDFTGHSPFVARAIVNHLVEVSRSKSG